MDFVGEPVESLDVGFVGFVAREAAGFGSAKYASYVRLVRSCESEHFLQPLKQLLVVASDGFVAPPQLALQQPIAEVILLLL